MTPVIPRSPGQLWPQTPSQDLSDLRSFQRPFVVVKQTYNGLTGPGLTTRPSFCGLGRLCSQAIALGLEAIA